MQSNESPHPLLARLNPVQREAVQHTEGPLLIFAGAGSGKTRVLTHRVAWLIAEHGVAPRHILAVTFTNKAAQEMKERIEQLIGEGQSRALWVGTFHATCARILRESGDQIGLERDFLVYDDGDQIALIRECLHQLQLDDKKFAPRAVLSQINRAKEKLITPEAYAETNQGFFEKVCGQVYTLYRDKLLQNRALDFDDLLMMAVRLFQQRPETLERYQNRFHYILVDEYQDVNYAQYVLLKLLAAKHRNLCVVGDDDQCVVEGTQILTTQGEQPVECLRPGGAVLGASGWGRVTVDNIEETSSRDYQGTIIRLRTGRGDALEATPNHMMFARIQPQSDLHCVYLMYRRGRGYRIGKTQGVRTYRSDEDVVSGLRVRTTQEVADRVWLLKTCRSREEAAYYEQFFAFQYGIPKSTVDSRQSTLDSRLSTLDSRPTVFHVRARRMAMTQEQIERLYREIDTEERAQRLMQDLLLSEEYPHHIPSAVIRGQSERKVVYLTIFGDGRPTRAENWYYHRIQLVSSDGELRRKADSVFNTRAGKGKTWRIEVSRKDYADGFAMARRLMSMDDLEFVCRACLTAEARYHLLPASHVHVGMRVPVFHKGEIVEDVITDVEWLDYEGNVYDLSVTNLRNYVANGLVVHNSIYAFRGADVGLILQFERDYPEAKVLKLEQNYRSTKTILDAAYGVVSKNRGRKDKRLWTEKEEGAPIQRYEAENEQEEAVYVVQKIREKVLTGQKRYRDFAILYRTNAQ
jgi:DNA helicase-2/ATP-dependent DNA helicase PcrA